MTFTIQRAKDRGTADHGWLKANFSFSFSQYYNPNRMGFGPLRVLNDDLIAPNSGFPSHPHANMEIITLVLEGELTHTDSMGNDEILKPWDMQIMSAGSGVTHSEFNHSDKPVSLFQLWIEPNKLDIEPSHKTFSVPRTKNTFIDIIPGIKSIKQDAELCIGDFTESKEEVINANSKGLFIMVIEGEIIASGEKLTKRDSVETTDDLTLSITPNTRLLVIRLPL